MTRGGARTGARRPWARALAVPLALGLLGAAPAGADEAGGAPGQAATPERGRPDAPEAPAEGPGIEDGVARYRMEPRPTGGVWRLDTRTGEVCVFGFPGSQPGAAVLNAGCSLPMGTEDGEQNGRFELALRPGGEVWRLDRVTGRLCIFSYRPGDSSPIVVEGCSRDEPARGL